MQAGSTDGLIFWAAQPYGFTDISLLKACAGLAEPFLDLRYGGYVSSRQVVLSALNQGLGRITCAIEPVDADMLEFLLRTLPAECRVVLCGDFETETFLAEALRDLKAAGLLAGVEADGRRMGRMALRCGAEFVLASGCEAGGFVSTRTTSILAQELCAELDLPVVVRGSVGPLGAAALYAAGCAGCVLDTQILLTEESPIGGELRRRLEGISATDCRLFGDLVGRAYRGLPEAGSGLLSDLSQTEQQVFWQNEDREEQSHRFRNAIAPFARTGVAGDLKPVGQGIEFAQRFAERGLSARETLLAYRRSLARGVERIRRHWPFKAGSPLARRHGTELPVVQGPMAVITDGPELAKEVANHGGLPFMAVTGVDGPDVRKRIATARTALDGAPFGVGLLAFADGSELADALLEDPPKAVVIAGGNPADALPFQEAGVLAYLHTPTPSHLRSAVEAGVSGVILEGHEAGGHVGSLGSLVLWELAVDELTECPPDVLKNVRVLLAGGLATERSALMAAVLAAPLAEQGMSVGLQLGTAYLLTEEAVTSGVIAEGYRHSLQMAAETAISGRSLNLPSRWTLSPSFRPLVEREMEIATSDRPLSEKKREYERIVRELLEASIGQGGLDESPPHMCGQVIGCARDLLSMAQLHADLTAGGELLAAELQPPQESEEAFGDAIAVIGMGCIFPGARETEEFWQNLCDKVSAIGEVPPDRWQIELYYDQSGQDPDKSASRLGAFIRGFEKDPVRFHIPPVAADSIDRGQFLALEVARQAMEDAGYLERDYPRERTGVMLGNSMGGELAVDYGMRILRHRFAAVVRSTPAFKELPVEVQQALEEQAMEAAVEDVPEITEDSCPGTLGSIFAGRICNQFNLGGISYTLDGACASSLAAVNAGIQGLRSRELDLVLAGGVETRMDPSSYVMFSSLGVLSDTGSFPFDDRADGFVMGEGVGMVVLKRYPDAVRDGDRIYAVIRGVGSSSDGSSKSVTAPHVPGQVEAMRRAYRGRPFTPADIAFVEAHGTATQTGDPTELTSLTQVFGPHSQAPGSVALGSVKSMLGHMKTAAGIAGLMKVALGVYHGVLPPTINCEQPRSDYDWDTSPFYLNSEMSPWPNNGLPRRGAVNSFGFGGVNFHMVLEEPPTREGSDAITPQKKGSLPAELFVLRAPNRSQLLARMEDLEADAAAGKMDLQALARQIWRNVGSGPCSLAVLGRDVEDIRSRLAFAREALQDPDCREVRSAQGVYYGEEPLRDNGKIAFLFPGQGSQYVGMADDLLEGFPFLCPVFEDVAAVARRWTGHEILPLMFLNGDTEEAELERLREKMVRTDYNHPALLALWCANDLVLRRGGIRPDMVAGHSVGEYGALLAARVLGLEATGAVTCVRGARAYEKCHRTGAMAAVAGSAELVGNVLREVSGLVVVANKNCRMQSVISGETAAVDRAVKLFKQRGLRCRRLRVSSAFHTDLMSPCVKPFREALEGLPVRPPEIPVQCNVTGSAYRGDGGFADELRDALARHLVSPVEFMDNIESLYAQGARFFLEIGPGSTLCSFTDNILGDRPHWSFATNLYGVSPALQLLHSLAYCFARGLDIDLPAVLPGWGRELSGSGQAAFSVPVLHEAGAVRNVAPGVQDPFADALEDAPHEEAESYLESRRPFLQGMLENMVRLDFQDFAGKLPRSERQEEGTLLGEVLSIFARRTGYPRDAIDPDLDLEAELGLDSIKQTEILAELEDQFQIDLRSRVEMRTRDEISTVRGVARVVGKAMGNTEPGERAIETEAPTEEEPEWKTDCYRLVCELRDAGAPEPGQQNRLDGKHVVLLSAGAGPTDPLQKRLTRVGASVSVLVLEDFEPDLLSDPEIVVDLCGWTPHSPPVNRRCDEWACDIERRSRDLLAVIGALVSRARERNEKCLWVEATPLGGQLGAGPVEGRHVFSAVGLALSRCMFSDYPDLFDVLYVDFEPDADPDEFAGCLLTEMSSVPGHPEIGYRNGRRHEIHWVRADREHSGQKPLPKGSVVLAVGGSRGITASMCRELAARTEAHFIIVGRSEVATAEGGPGEPEDFESARAELIRELRSSGGRVVPAEVDEEVWQRVWDQERRHNLAQLEEAATSVDYRQCDVTDASAVQRLIAEVNACFGRIDLVLSGAGALVEKRIDELDPDLYVAGLRPKAVGTANLLAALADIQVGTFVNVSSIVGRWGHMGMASYGVGHEVASLLTAASRGERTGKWHNLIYGPWLQVGMTRVGETSDRVRRSGGSFVTEQEGIDYFISELQGGEEKTTAFRGLEPFGVLMAGGDSSDEYPMLDSVEATGRDLAKAVSSFDPTRDSLLAGHRVSGEVLLPGVAAIEMMAETAGILADPQKVLVEVRDVEFFRPMRFPRGRKRRFKTHVTRKSSGDEEVFECEVFTMFTPPDGAEPERVRHAACVLTFGTAEPPPEPSLLVIRRALGDHPIEMDSFWDTPLALGRLGVFRNIRAIEAVSDRTIIGDVFGSAGSTVSDRRCTGNWVRLDGMLYLSGLVDVFARRYPAHYLDGIESIRFYERDMASAAYRCRCRVTEWRGRSFLNDIEGLDALGAVRVRVRGAVSTRAQEPVHEGIGKTVFEDFLCHPQRKAFARRLDLATPLGLTEVEIPLVANDLNAAGPEEFLHTWLGPREREVFEDFKHPKRRSEWLAGRICAKEALRSLSEEAPGATDIEILTDTEGAPVVRYPGVLEGPRISIAHSKGLAVAAASDCASVGIDVEKVAYDVHRFQNKFCSVTEVRLVRDEAGELEVPTLMRLWVAKEAALKAARNGSVPLTSLCVQGVELDDLYIVVDLQGDDGTPVRAVTFRSHDYYYAVAAKTRDPQ